MEIELPTGEIAEFPDSMPMAEIEAVLRKQFPPLTQAGQAAAEDDVLGVGASGVDMPTEYGAEQAVRQYMQAPTFGYGEEIESAITGKPVEDIRQAMAYYAKQRPDAAMAAELTGAIVNPLSVIAPAARPLVQAFTGGTLYGSGKAEGDVANRFKEGLKTGAIAVPFTWGLQKVINVPSKALAARAAMADEKMTAESLRTAAKQAYKDADLAGTLMQPKAVQDLYNRASSRVAGDIDYEEGTHTIADRALRMLERRQTNKMTFDGLEDMRQRMWKLHNQATKAGDDMQANYVRDVIDEIDNTVDKIPFKSEALKNARQAWKQSQKASTLDAAIKKGERRAASTGSGGNVANVYLQAVRGMLEDKKNLKFFSPEEIKIMEEFVRTGAGGRFQRSLSKLSPNGNGLMLALHAFGAAAVDPSMLVGAGVGAAAQAAGERRVRSGAQEIMEAFGGKVPSQRAETAVPLGISSYGAEQLKKQEY
jgi:hypothetical protein